MKEDILEFIIWFLDILKEVLVLFHSKIIWGLGLLFSFILMVTGGEDKAIVGLLIIMGIDYLTGVIKSIYLKTTNSQKGYRGLLKKIMILIIIALGYQIDIIFDLELYQYNCRFIIICFYIANEALSILENASLIGLPIPESIKSFLEQYTQLKIKK